MFASLSIVAVVARSFDDLGTPLCDVTFVVLDLETTGGSPATCAITEIGAVKVRGGEVLSTFHTLVNPGVTIPPSITFLTGITEAMVVPAPRIEAVLETFVDFVGGAVIVGHNVRFDLGFLAAAMAQEGFPRFANTVVDTCALARRLVRDEVPNCKLQTLAQHFRATNRPTHRALDDARATVEVLHALLERAGSMGVLGLEDLVALPTVGSHPQLGKLTLTRSLPRAPGVYVFRDAGGRPLYVGKAVDLRRRVRSYFTGDDRRKIGGLLRELVSIDHVVCANELEASVLEVRLIHNLTPRYNTRTKHWRSYAYVKVTLDEAWPRLSVVRQSRAGDGCQYLGPVGSVRTARLIVDAIETALPVRRCTTRLSATAGARRESECTAAQLGVAACPCAGTVTRDEYSTVIDCLIAGLTSTPQLLLAPLADRLRRLSVQQRYEEAAELRDRAAALSRALDRQRRHDALRRAGRVHLRVGADSWAVVEDGILRDSGRDGQPGTQLRLGDGRHLWDEPARKFGVDGTGAGRPGEPVPRRCVDELTTIVSWMEARSGLVRIVECEDGLSWPADRLATFESRPSPGSPRRTPKSGTGQRAPDSTSRPRIAQPASDPKSHRASRS